MKRIDDMTPGTLELAQSLGIRKEEYDHVCRALERVPNYAELGIFSAMFSEHCSYKSSKRFLRRLPTKGPRVLQGPGENAGVIDIGEGWAISFKVESHNHPSFIEPFQGAATGVGGILRDVFTMGARPIAAMDGLCFGAIDKPDTRRVSEGVVRGIGSYGNSFGVPTVGGQTLFHRSYNGNPLVNAFTIGLLKSDKIFRGYASGVGNPVVYVGAKTGRDGVHGATMASQEFSSEKELERPAVQVGDPFTEKLLLEATLEAMEKKLIVGIQDMGAAGITSSSFEMAHRAKTGLYLNLDAIPTRETEMSAYELLLSESQERMLLVTTPDKIPALMQVYEKWDLHSEIVGRVTDTQHVEMDYKGNRVVDLPVQLVTEPIEWNLPLAPLEEKPKQWEIDLQAIHAASMQSKFQTLLSDPNFASSRPITEQYDSMIGNRTEGGYEDDAAVLRLRDIKEAPKRIALSMDCNSRLCYLWPLEGGRRAVAESALNLATRGAEPVGLTDCLNFGNPENPDVLRQFEQCVEGISSACEALKIPVVSGNVSLYNDTDGVPILPTPMVVTVGLIDNNLRLPHQKAFETGLQISLVGDWEGALEGSSLSSRFFDKECGKPSETPLEEVRNTISFLVHLQSKTTLEYASKDVSDGGLTTSLLELLFASENLGCELEVPVGAQADRFLFGESCPRVILLHRKKDAIQIETLAEKHQLTFTAIGEVNESGKFSCTQNENPLFSGSISELKTRWENKWRPLF